MAAGVDGHFVELRAMGVPVRRAAYGDRTAWTTAILAEPADLLPERWTTHCERILG